MGDNTGPRPPFVIRRVDPTEPARPQPRRSQTGGGTAASSNVFSEPTSGQSAGLPVEPAPVLDSSPAEPILTGARFRSATAVLAFLGSVAGSGLSREAVVRRSTDGQWWAEVSISPTSLASLVMTWSGMPYSRMGSRWLRLDGSGRPIGGRQPWILDLSRWRSVDLLELLAESGLKPSRYSPAERVEVIAPGAFGGWVLRKATTLGLDVAMVPVIQRSLTQDNESGALRMTLRSRAGAIPAALVHALCNLPYVIVGVAAGQGDGDLVVDVRVQPPLAANLLVAMLPSEETWVLGPPELGHCRLRATGSPVDAAAIIDVPDITVNDVLPAAQVALPGRIPVALVAKAGTYRVDAVLIDDTELGWLRSFLAARPIAEAAFLLPGSGSHLLLAPGDLAGRIPFGTPLHRQGPGGLFVEVGFDFFPPLPEAARVLQFGLSAEVAVAIVHDGPGYRFRFDQITPAWSLFVGEAPNVRDGLSARGEQLLRNLSDAIRNAEAEQAETRYVPKPGITTPRIADVPKLLEQAAKEEARGNLVRAAELLEEAGQPGRAGRLYERAAGRG